MAGQARRTYWISRLRRLPLEIRCIIYGFADLKYPAALQSYDILDLTGSKKLKNAPVLLNAWSWVRNEAFLTIIAQNEVEIDIVSLVPVFPLISNYLATFQNNMNLWQHVRIIRIDYHAVAITTMMGTPNQLTKDITTTLRHFPSVELVEFIILKEAYEKILKKSPGTYLAALAEGLARLPNLKEIRVCWYKRSPNWAAPIGWFASFPTYVWDIFLELDILLEDLKCPVVIEMHSGSRIKVVRER